MHPDKFTCQRVSGVLYRVVKHELIGYVGPVSRDVQKSVDPSHLHFRFVPISLGYCTWVVLLEVMLI